MFGVVSRRTWRQSWRRRFAEVVIGRPHEVMWSIGHLVVWGHGVRRTWHGSRSWPRATGTHRRWRSTWSATLRRRPSTPWIGVGTARGTGAWWRARWGLVSPSVADDSGPATVDDLVVGNTSQKLGLEVEKFLRLRGLSSLTIPFFTRGDNLYTKRGSLGSWLDRRPKLLSMSESTDESAQAPRGVVTARL